MSVNKIFALGSQFHAHARTEDLARLNTGIASRAQKKKNTFESAVMKLSILCVAVLLHGDFSDSMPGTLLTARRTAFFPFFGVVEGFC